MKSSTLIRILVASNLAFAGLSIYEAIVDSPSDELYADHVQQLRMDVERGVLRVRLGRSSSTGGPTVENAQPSGTLALTPRAALQLDVELRRTFDLIQRAAQKNALAPPPQNLQLAPDREL
jgi:hypothetical protein